jgi:hypothetical protein
VNGRWGAVVGLIAGGVALGPSLARGYILRYDLVFVPDPPITASTLGLDGGVPRAVPDDLLVSLASHLVASDVLEKLVLLAAFVLAGAGIARLVDSRAGAVVAAAAYTWNPWVAERLLIGHWAFLLGYAALPWLIGSAVSLRQLGRRSLATLCLTTVVAGLAGSTAWAFAVLVTLPVLLWPRGRRLSAREWWLWAGTTAGSAAVWAVPSLAHPGGIAPDPFGFTAFASRGDGPLGVWGQLLTLGGIWNSASVPPERGSTVVLLIGAALVCAALIGGVPLLWRWSDGLGAAVVVTGIASLFLAGVTSIPGVAVVVGDVAGRLPWLGLFRDGHKWLAPFALVVCLCVGHAVQRLRPVMARLWSVLVVAAVLAPVVLLPSLAWGAGGRLVAVEYPVDWIDARRAVAALPSGTDVASLPSTYYRRFAWNDARVVLDPMPRYLPRVVVVVDDLPLRDGTVRGEDPRGRALRDALDGGRPLGTPLRAMGISGVVLATDQPSSATVNTTGLTEVARATGLAVYSVTGPVATPPRSTPVTVVGLLAWAVTIAVTVVSWALPRARRLLASRRPAPESTEEGR